VRPHSVGALAMPARTGGGPLPVDRTPLGWDVARAVRHLPALLAVLDATSLVVLRGGGGPPLPVQVPLQPVPGRGSASALGADGLEERLLLTDHGADARPQIPPDSVWCPATAVVAARGPVAHEVGRAAVSSSELASDQQSSTARPPQHPAQRATLHPPVATRGHSGLAFGKSMRQRHRTAASVRSCAGVGRSCSL
jgi:hypothetical protein